MAIDNRYKTKINLNFDRPYHEIENSMAIAIRLMLEDTHRLAEPVTPKKEGFLRAGVTKQMLSNTKGVIRWAENYAAAQEEGKRRDPRTGKVIYFKNYTTPGTHAGYIKQALEKVIQRLPMYIQLGGLK